MRVNVVKRVQTLKGDRYCPVVASGSGCIQPDWVIVNGVQEKHPEGCYYLECRENGRRKRHSVGKDATVALDSKIRMIKELEARAMGLEVRASEDNTNRLRLRSAMTAFLEEIKLSRHNKTWQGYKVVFDYFLESCNKNRIDDIERLDLLCFEVFLRVRKKLACRTVRNKLSQLRTFFDAQGMPNLLAKNDMPQYVKKEVEIFEGNQLIDLYQVCSLRDRVLYDFMLMTGFREQEAMYVTWGNILFGASVIEMRWKPQFNWLPKTNKEREVPVPSELLDSLRFYRKALPPKRAVPEALVFSTRSGKPDLHMLRGLKRNAKRAGLMPEDFWFHKFRATFATTHLRAGVDLRTVMTWMGQTALESINRYLKPARKEEAIDKVNLSFTGPTFANRRRVWG
jgi:integrase